MKPSDWQEHWLPLLPMHATIVFEPLDVDESQQHEMYVQLQSMTRTYLEEFCTDGRDITYIQF